MLGALSTMDSQKQSLIAVYNKAEEVKVAVPKAFEASNTDYLNSIENKRLSIEKCYQDTLNVGFKQMYITVFCVNLLAAIVLLFYKEYK